MPVDTRFFEALGAITVGEVASLVSADASAKSDRVLSGIAAADMAGPSDLCFFEGPAAKAASVSATAGACLIKSDAAEHLPDGVTAIVCDTPRLSHIRVAKTMFRLRHWDSAGQPPSIHPTANVAVSAVIGNDVAIGANVTIGPGAVIGPGVQIGHDTVIGANASLQCALLGNHVTILSGARIGESGFGVTSGPDGAEDVPQWGRVIIQDHVMIGGNTCVDRGAFTDTIIGERSKIDNLCQIGHNVVIGRNVLMASFSGISGSCTIGDGVIMGGRVGIADHIDVGDGAVLTADAGVMTSIPAGETWGGRPAKPFRQFLREVAWLQRQVKRGKKPAS